MRVLGKHGFANLDGRNALLLHGRYLNPFFKKSKQSGYFNGIMRSSEKEIGFNHIITINSF